jgi:hypothetical protein
MKDLFREIKYAYQRVVMGYDDRIFFELDGYFDQFIPPIKEFCQTQVKQEKLMKLDPKRKDLFEETLKRIDAYEKMDFKDLMKWNEITKDLWGLIGENITSFWD